MHRHDPPLSLSLSDLRAALVRPLVLVALVAGACNLDDSDTTVVTTVVTHANSGNPTHADLSTGEPYPGDSFSSTYVPTSSDASETEGVTTVEAASDPATNTGAPPETDSRPASASDTDSATASASDSATATDSDSATASASDSATATATDTDSPDDTAGEGGESGDVCDQMLLAMTPECVVGSEIQSVAWADARCATTFGAGWTWLEHHQQGGWFVDGHWNDDNGIGQRGWITINDQDSECFSNTYGVTWVRTVGMCRAECWSTVGLEGPEYHPQDHEKCNSYEGDTPCDHCRPLICGKA